MESGVDYVQVVQGVVVKLVFLRHGDTDYPQLDQLESINYNVESI